MRCRECNVDLPDIYCVCPLCNSKTFDDAPLIKDVCTDEYPEFELKKQKINPFAVFVVLWAVCSVASAVLFKLGLISEWFLATGICTLPCIWTLIVRPVAVKQLYSGNFIVMNFYSFGLFCAFISFIKERTLQACFTNYLPLCFVVVMTALFVVIFVDFKNCKRSSSYSVLGSILSVTMFVICFIKYQSFAYMWLVSFAVSVIMLIFLFCVKPYETKEELKAKFSIQ